MNPEPGARLEALGEDTEACIIAFREVILGHFLKHGRSMPWRQTVDPYRILVSEFMLQQTQVSRVLVKYPEFLGRFPDWHSLADARLADVVGQWQGLGYNRRAKYLHQTAGEVVSRFNGALPADQQELSSLPGIGINTAGAICAFAFGRPVIFIETNIRRVFLHFFFQHQSEVGDAELRPLIASSLDHSDPRRWYWALMDYGAMLKTTVTNPNRRSAHYNRQSRFEGSRRQLRGAVLRLLSDGSRRSLDDLQRSAVPDADQRLRGVVADLVDEGFLACEDERFYLR